MNENYAQVSIINCNLIAQEKVICGRRDTWDEIEKRGNTEVFTLLSFL